MIAYESRRWMSTPYAERSYWWRHARKQRSGVTGHDPIRFGEVVSRDHLFYCFQQLKNHGGPAAGPDGIRAADVSNHEFGDIAQRLSDVLTAGEYQPSTTRSQRIPKRSGNGTRTLKIANLCDRVVGKALHSALSPAMEECFLDGSWGFRPHRNAWGMLASILDVMESEKRWVIASDDVRDAFDNVPIDGVQQAHRNLLQNELAGHFHHDDQEQLLQLVETVLRGADPNRQVGIDQGNPYSPTALNVLLHTIHDAPLDGGAVSLRWFRYADNLVYPTRSVSEGRQALDHVRQLLMNATPPPTASMPHPAPLQLKSHPGVRDLGAGETCPLLGFKVSLRKQEPLIGPGEDSWVALGQSLRNVHGSPRPQETARMAVLGWVESCGPAFEMAEASVPDILRTAARYGFREVATPGEIHERWYASWLRWESLRQRSNSGGRME